MEFLAAALYIDDPALFTEFITRAGQILTARDIPAGALLPALDLLAGQLSDFPRARRLLAAAEQAVEQVLRAQRGTLPAPGCSP